MGTENKKPLHLDKKTLFCNRCLRYMDKFTETLVLDDEVYCLFCDNWLCGKFDAFGDLSESPTITHIRKGGEKND